MDVAPTLSNVLTIRASKMLPEKPTNVILGLVQE